MRWFIEESKRKISTYDFKNHKDDIEMSGEKVSMIIGYGADENNKVYFSREIIFPMFRIYNECCVIYTNILNYLMGMHKSYNQVLQVLFFY